MCYICIVKKEARNGTAFLIFIFPSMNINQHESARYGGRFLHGLLAQQVRATGS